MKNQKNSKKVLAGILAAQVVLQAAALNISAFADDATDAEENLEVNNVDASVVSAADDALTIANGTSVPEKLVEGKYVVVKGTVSSAVSNITKITVGVYDTNNNCVAEGSVDVKEKTFDLSQLDDKLSFNKLATGDYYYKVIVSNASNTDYVLVNQSFTVTKTGEEQTSTLPTPAASEDELTISGQNTVPDEMKTGGSFNIQGTVTSADSDIVYLTAGVYNANGEFVTGRTIAPKAKTYDIRKLDSYLAFNKLEAGRYIYAVIATNASHQNVALVNKQFSVVGENGETPAATSDAITIADGTVIPDNLGKGKYLSVKGKVTSESSNITSLTVGVYDTNNKLVTGKTVSPDAKTYNLANLDNYVSFNTLAEGTYTYSVTATNSANKDFTVTSKTFTVGSQTSATDELKLENGTTVPAQLEKGKSVSIKGTVSSTTSNITSLTVGIYENRQGGKIITEKTVSPNTKTYDLSKLDSAIAFNKLTDGTYAYVVIATNANNGNYTLTNQSFTVGNGATATNDTLTVSNATVIPDNLAKGKSLTVKGTITSASSNITSLTVGVFDENNKLVTGKTVSPNVKTYDLNKLDNYVSFNTLKDGTYTYAVVATNSANKDFTVTSKKFTVGNGQSQTTTAQNCKISGGTTIPANIAVGKSVSIRGTVSAPETITSIKAGVRKADSFAVGDWVTFGTATPNAKSYDLHNLDNSIVFGKLPAGEYAYCVEVTTASGVVIPEDGAQRFTVGNGGSQTVGQDMTVTNGTVVPANLAKGKAVNVKGTITSPTNITSLTVAVADAALGGFMTGKTVTPNAKTYDLSKLDADVAFSKLPDGEYRYYVMASNEANPNGVVVTETVFKVGNGTSATEDKMTVSNGTVVPANLAKGKTLSVKGTITSASSNITSLTVGVYDSKGKLVTGKTVAPNAKSYDLSKLDAYVSFNKLDDGIYNYCVVATNSASKDYRVVDSQFTVGNAVTPEKDKLTITGGTTVPSNLAKGKGVRVTGTVTSSGSNITALTVGVYDANGKFVTGRTVAPNAKSYDISKLDNYVAFNTLGDGEYSYAVIAANSANSNYTLVNQKFTVGNGGSSTTPSTNDKLTISGGTNVPDNLAKGKALNVTGTVTSASSNMTALTVGVYDTNGKFITGRTIAPNAKTYDLRKLDAYVAFNTLPEGNYIYAVIATNAGNTNYALVNKKFTVGNGGTSSNADALKISGGTNVPDNLAVGKALNVTGTVTSASSNMTALTVGVYDSNGKFITGRTIAPNAKTYDLRKLDAYVAFNKLPAGNYIYAVIASNAANNNYALVNKKFTVGNGGSGTSSATDDSLKVSGGTSVPSSLSKGRGVSVRGTVNSSSNITSLTVGVYDANGKLVTGKTVSPNAKSYNLSSLDSSVRFDKLSAGSYTYKVIATNGGNSSTTLVNQSFTVK